MWKGTSRSFLIVLGKFFVLLKSFISTMWTRNDSRLKHFFDMLLVIVIVSLNEMSEIRWR